MERVSLSMLKAQAMGRRVVPLQQQPREGSALRAVWDHLMACKARPVWIHELRRAIREAGLVVGDGYINSSFHQLRDFYGLDIRRVRSGCWMLAGDDEHDWLQERLVGNRRKKT